MSLPILQSRVKFEEDVAAVRRRSREIAGMLGFDPLEQTRVAAAVSEIARNACSYAGGGEVQFFIEGKSSPQLLQVRVSDRGPGISDLKRLLEGRRRPKNGVASGILGAQRLVDKFQIESTPGRGTTVSLIKFLPRSAPVVGAAEAARIAGELTRSDARGPLQEMREQNRELLSALEELRRRQEELTRLNLELEDTNRGVVALYAELDERADHLRRADELKSRFLSNMSHEFRTPLNSILGLCRLLLERCDGDLSAEQEKQVQFIKKAADDLSQLVNDLLDLAKVEAGKVVVHPSEFEVESLFGALRGMMRPILLSESVNLLFEEPTGLPALHTDEGKVSQILRNFISNALKFTERGEVRVSAALSRDGREVIFSVADTGVGIALEDQELIFQEFIQIESRLQKRVKGTGLGLPLCRKLAGLLGGSVTVQSEPGVGSTFHARIPRIYVPPVPAEPAAQGAWEPDPNRMPVLVVEDAVETMLLYEKYLNGSGFQLLPARTVAEAEQALKAVRPAAVVLDILLKGEDSWELLTRLKRDASTRDIPVLVATQVDDSQKATALGADACCRKPCDRQWLLEQLHRLTCREAMVEVLVIDDDPVSRYLLRQLLPAPGYRLKEAENGGEGLRRAREEGPRAIFLDLKMPDMSGFEVLDRLKADPATRKIPVIVLTSLVPQGEERSRLSGLASDVLSKQGASRAVLSAALEEAFSRSLGVMA